MCYREEKASISKGSMRQHVTEHSEHYFDIANKSQDILQEQTKWKIIFSAI